MLDSQKGNVLVLGCGDGSDAARIVSRYAARLINIDIRLTQEADVVCDGHNLPFQSGLFDAVLIQGVLEHVLRPQIVADEVYRVLKDTGLVYCEFPFMQPTHGAAFDFSRLTYTGHRLLWRRFAEVSAGACCGPGMALAHSIQQFFRSLVSSRIWRFAIEIAVGWCFWWLKYVDEWLVQTPAGLDGASAYYFLGRKSDEETSDADIIKSYRGAQL